MWWVITAIGALTAAMMWLYDKFMKPEDAARATA
jgi:hypothetical protein